jgi:hypothetical protein
MNKLLYIITFFVIICGFIACEKNVTVEIPETEELLVVEGYIETGTQPIVLLTKSLPFFGHINSNDILVNSITGATVIIDNGTVSDTLDQIPGYGIYTSTSMTGETGKTYRLTIITGDKTLTAETTIPNPVKLDSVWWKPDGNRDSLGFAWAHLTDPDTLNNCYRWFARRINHYTTGSDSGDVKDSIFIAPLGSVFDDKYINNKSFDFNFPRGNANYSTKEDDNNDERFYFKRGDTIVLKFTSIDRAHFKFWRSEETQVGNNGNPFGSPAPVYGNINGGLGIWGGYSPAFDTIIAQ